VVSCHNCKHRVHDRVTIQPDRSVPAIGCEVMEIKIENNIQQLKLRATDPTRVPELTQEFYSAGSVKVDQALVILK